MAKQSNSRTVYSTEMGKMCPGCHRSVGNCSCSPQQKRSLKKRVTAPAISNVAKANDPQDGVVRIRLEKKGRGGKAVTSVNGLPGDEKELKVMAKKIKSKLGTGGAIKDGVVEFQGDRRQDVQKHIEAMGFSVKLVGG